MIISDLHIHSRFARACSKDTNIENLEKYARIKGLNLIGTGDFQHPQWNKELKQKLTDDGTGILRTKTGFPFMLQTEISLMYKQDNKGRRIHHVVLAPSFEVVDQITEELLKRGRIDYDGRPIFGISSIEFIEMLRKISTDIEVIPAHIYTPYFGLFGSKTGFDSVEECFKDQAKHIHALETGMSSDLLMNWRLSRLDKYNLVSFSDMHSFWPWRIGREATAFDCKLTYKNILNAIRTKEGLGFTVEVNPNYGIYHYDGHRKCKICMSPKEALEHKNICPVCGKQLTLGVLHRIEELADREEGFVPKDAQKFRIFTPLSELIAASHGSGLATQKTWSIFNKLIESFENEFNILINVPEEELKKVADEKLTAVIMKNREHKIRVKPGYDGEYGKVTLDEKEQVHTARHPIQKGLNEF